MINQWKIAENGGVGKSVPEKCKTPLTFTLKGSHQSPYRRKESVSRKIWKRTKNLEIGKGSKRWQD